VRRTLLHALAGAGALVLAVVILAAGLLSSPTSSSTALGEPRTDPSVTTSVPSVGRPSVQQWRADQISRDTQRPALAAEIRARTATKRRAAALERQQQAIAARAAALAKQRAQQARKRAAAATARRQAIARLGYTPGTTDPRSMARQILQNKYGYGAGQFACFNNIIMRESMWDIHATNGGSGAYGIPQALPGSKMASAGADWRTNPATQIIWGIRYMKSTYGSPCGAWGFKRSHGWY
jgi:hypothetical protein